MNVRIRSLGPTEPRDIAPVPGKGYIAAGPKEHPPAYLNPSAISEIGKVGEAVHIGKRLLLSGSPNMTALGEAIHGFLAADRQDLEPTDRELLAKGLLERWGVASALAPKAVLQASDTLRAWVAKEWPDAKWHREWPIQHRLPEGTVVRGTADLVLETTAGYILIDHKTFPGMEEKAAEKAATFVGQLEAYAQGVIRATGCLVIGKFIHLPVLGVAFSVAANG